MATATRSSVFRSTPDNDQEAIAHQSARLAAYPWFLTLCRAAAQPLVILNDEHQVIKANPAALTMYDLTHEEPLLGATLDRRFASHAEFVQEDHQNYWVVSLDDGEAEANRWALEKVFLHDILNTAGGMKGLSDIMADATPAEMPFLQETINNVADQLVDEITAQRDFLSAENGDLIVEPKPVNAQTLAEQIATRYRKHPVTEDRKIHVVANTHIVFCADPTLLSRVLGNMVKNALEASPERGIITIDYGREENQVWFSVHNRSFIPLDIQPHIFARSYSTKGAGRGLGTYGMRMLSEQFMNGNVDFTTSEGTGTTFKVSLPDGACS